MGNYIEYIETCCSSKSQNEIEEAPLTAKEMTASFSKMYDSNNLNKSNINENKNKNGPLYLLKDSVLIGKGSGNPIDKYTIDELIGKGDNSLVYKATLRSNGDLRSFKVIQKNNELFLKTQELLKEIELLEAADNPYIVKLYEFYDCPTVICLVNEYLNGGSLLERLKKEKKFNEFTTAIIIFQILSALSFCHSKKIIHRNLTLSNILINEEKDHFIHVKIIDFNESTKIIKGVELGDSFLNLKYTAPEVIKGKYNEKRDVWSVGVIMYTLLTGNFPFDNDDIFKLKALIEIGNVDYDNKSLTKCSNECIDLLKELLNRNINRISANEALNHNWFKTLNIKERLNEISYETIKSVLDNIIKFKPKTTLQKLCLSYLARNLHNENIQNASNLFCQIDVNNDGEVQENEFVNNLKEIIEKTGENVDIKYLKKLFKIIDIDKSGIIEYSEFLAAAINREQIINEKTLKESFDFFDKGNNGLINLNDLKVVFKKYKGFSIDDFKSIVDDVDLDENKEINFEEYKNMMLNMLD